jgi:dihydrofolate synthase / folylpolyglutamate synthase
MDDCESRQSSARPSFDAALLNLSRAILRPVTLMSLDASTDLTTRPAVMEFLLGRIDYERMSSVPYSAQDFKLDRMRTLLARLGNPQDSLPVVHIAGTKGKGSTSAMVASILTAAGYKTGLYTSPHLNHIEERLMIDGAACPSGCFVDAVAVVAPIVAEMDSETSQTEGSNRPTYFEILTATALVYFARAKVDAVVLEVGLGGRLDSTNVCHPAVTAITSISFDHVQQLGNSLALIAAEKAGIIKHGVPVISGVTTGEARDVIARISRELQAPIGELEREFGFEYQAPPSSSNGHPGRKATMNYWFRRAEKVTRLNGVEINLLGRHQAANASVAIAICQELRRQGWKIEERHVRGGLQTVRWPGRMEVMCDSPTVIRDAAHNVASIEALLVTLRESFTGRRKRLLFATTRDKDVAGMLRLILPEFDEVVFTRYLNNPRAAEPEELASLARQISGGKPVSVAATPIDAWTLMSDSARSDDLIVITGSFFIAGEMRTILLRNAVRPVANSLSA